MKPLQLGYTDSCILLAQQREGVSASHVIFKMTVTKTPQVKKIDSLSMRLLHLFKSVR